MIGLSVGLGTAITLVGLRGLVDRIGALDGTLHVESPAGLGTALRAELPLRATGPGPTGPTPAG